MDIEVNGTEYFVKRGPSIFVSRNGKQDCTVDRYVTAWQGLGGGMRPGRSTRSMLVHIFAAESGEVLRNYEDVPRQLIGRLIELGLVDKHQDR